MKQKFMTAVNNSDVIMVRIFLTGELMLDPRGYSFREMLAYADSKIHDLFDSDDNSELVTDQLLWDNQYLSKLKSQLDSNFSKKKLSLYESVAKSVLKDKAKALDEEEAKAKQKKEHDNSASENADQCLKSRKGLYTGITVGGMAVAIGGFCTSKVVLASFGIFGIIVGGVLLYNNSKNEHNI